MRESVKSDQAAADGQQPKFNGNTRKLHGVIAGPVPQISIRMAQWLVVGMAGLSTGQAMTKWEGTTRFAPVTSTAVKMT